MKTVDIKSFGYKTCNSNRQYNKKKTDVLRISGQNYISKRKNLDRLGLSGPSLKKYQESVKKLLKDGSIKNDFTSENTSNIYSQKNIISKANMGLMMKSSNVFTNY